MFVGQFIALFVNSAVGLGLLLMASIYPLLVALGVSRTSAAAVIATTCCLDLGPSSSNAMRAADLCNMDVVTYFVQGQVLSPSARLLPLQSVISLSSVGSIRKKAP